jgi:hypothetical protein
MFRPPRQGRAGLPQAITGGPEYFTHLQARSVAAHSDPSGVVPCSGYRTSFTDPRPFFESPSADPSGRTTDLAPGKVDTTLDTPLILG